MLFFCRILSLAYYFMAIYLEKSNLFLGFRFLFFKFSLIWLGNTEQCYGLSVLGTHQFNMILFDSFIFSCSPILCQLTYLQGETLEQIVYPKYCYKIDDRPGGYVFCWVMWMTKVAKGTRRTCLEAWRNSGKWTKHSVWGYLSIAGSISVFFPLEMMFLYFL